MKKTICMVVIAAALLSIAGCASVFKGGTEKVNFASDPSTASIYVNGQLMGKTPFELNLQSNKSYTIEFRKPGFQNKTVIINNKVGAGWIVLDIVLGLIPVIVDAATGDWMQLDQTTVNAALEAQQ